MAKIYKSKTSTGGNNNNQKPLSKERKNEGSGVGKFAAELSPRVKPDKDKK